VRTPSYIARAVNVGGFHPLTRITMELAGREGLMGKRSILNFGSRWRYSASPPYVFWLAAALMALFGSSTGAWGDPTPSSAGFSARLSVQGDMDTQPDVTIEAQRRKLEHRVDAFVSHATARVSDHESLARWNKQICPLVGGLPEGQGEFVLRRLSEIARSVGAPLAGSECRPNLYVVVSSEPTQLLKAWRKRNPYIFGPPNGRVLRHAMPAEVTRFLQTDRPVRVWYTTNADWPGDTNPYDSLNDLQSGYDKADSRAGGSSARLVWEVLLDLSSVIVVVDPRRTNNFTLSQLADYVAMVSFTQINLDADVSYAPTILRLFSTSPPEGSTPGGLSSWDRGLLKGLYHTDQASRTQHFAIARQAVSEIATSTE
jgi:hypothetical protein